MTYHRGIIHFRAAGWAYCGNRNAIETESRREVFDALPLVKDRANSRACSKCSRCAQKLAKLDAARARRSAA